jgi:putative ABC transport system permease protein
LRSSSTLEQATADLREAAATLRQTFPAQYDSTYGRLASVESLQDALVGRTQSTLFVLFAAVGLVLLIGCANVMNLLLARGAAREHELALRAALGAGRWRLVRQLLTESMLLALLGAALGLVFAVWGARLVGASLPDDLMRAGDIVVNARVLSFAALTAVIVGLVFGVVPALRAGRRSRLDSLRDGTRSSAAGSRRRTMRTLIVGEVALALMLATGTGLVLRSFWRLRAESPGFRPEGVLTLGVAAPGAIYDSQAKRVALYDALLERLRAIPGVTSVGAVHLLPFGGSNWNPELVVEGRATPPGAPSPAVDWRVATPDYFRTMGIALRRGRMFTAADDSASPRVALINEALARREFPGTDPLGKRVRTFFEGHDGWTTIVGVIADSKDQTLAGAARPQMYRPFAQSPLNSMSVMVRTTGEPMQVAPAARRALAAVDPDIPLERVRPLLAVVTESIAQPRLLVILLATFGALALVLGAIGIYGVMAYAVVQRTREIGVRSALGATPRDVLALVVGEALTLAVVGVALGVAGALALTGLLRSQLYAVSPTDPVTFLNASLGLLAVALLASAVPALRAMRVDPARVLRS